MRRKLLALVLALTFLVALPVQAATVSRSNSLKSHGVFHSVDSAGNDVLLDSADLHYLATQLDSLETAIDALSLSNNANIEYVYHHHLNSGGDILDRSTVYSTTPIGGCYAASGHTHNATGTCSTNTVMCGGWVKCISWHDYDNFCAKQMVCQTCGDYHRYEWRHGEPEPEPSTVCQVQTTYYTCGSPVNTYIVNCGRRINEIESASVTFAPSGN